MDNVRSVKKQQKEERKKKTKAQRTEDKPSMTRTSSYPAGIFTAIGKGSSKRREWPIPRLRGRKVM